MGTDQIKLLSGKKAIFKQKSGKKAINVKWVFNLKLNPEKTSKVFGERLDWFILKNK